nr:unnamed protein product [Callosobruchus analis]
MSDHLGQLLKFSVPAIAIVKTALKECRPITEHEKLTYPKPTKELTHMIKDKKQGRNPTLLLTQVHNNLAACQDIKGKVGPVKLAAKWLKSRTGWKLGWVRFEINLDLLKITLN